MILRKGLVLTMVDGEEPFVGDVRIDAGRIVEVSRHVGHAGTGEDELDVRGCVVLPGLVQAHVHLCQTLFRNLADDLELLDWLRERIWPFEAWLDEAAMAASARLGLFELISSGTTAILDMGSVRHADAVFAAAEESGIRYVGGKCLMDLDDGGHAPAALLESADGALAATEALIDRWHGAADGRLRYAVAPRFAVSCTDDLLRRAVALARERGVRLHTHASENTGECAIIERRTGKRNVEYLGDVGLLGADVVLAHGIHLDDGETALLARTGSHVAHCPSSNLKLASGIARVPELLDAGVNVALGADGAACNNRLSPFREMLLASLLQKPRLGPTALPAVTALEMATIRGARALGLEDEIGTLEPGKLGDVLVLDLGGDPATASAGGVRSAIVYSAGPANVRDVLVGGRFLKRDGEVTTLDGDEILRDAEDSWRRMARAFPDRIQERG